MGTTTILERLEWQAYDLKVRGTLIEQADPSLAIIDIDERSLYEIGQWPWPRATVAELVNILFTEYDAGLLGVDVVFAEPETTLWQQYWEDVTRDYPQLTNIPPPIDGDERLASTLSAHPVVLGYYFQAYRHPSDPPALGQLPVPAIVAEPQPLAFPEPERYTANLPVLQNNALGRASLTIPAWMKTECFVVSPCCNAGGELYPSLPMAMLLALLGQPVIKPIIGEGAGVTQLEALDVGGFKIPVDAGGPHWCPGMVRVATLITSQRPIF
ncbi:hypothetical protein HSBAA_21310 [Vreelandella sulfidaeris]|uniref:CHASE2 domain-containing protein n=1 Tax=Vreelandella sulfidaeris TaxID=115553 RepID=A0A455U4I5_9GAMM|nr:hypothetical protein HSBAA_21310 [Halomonas sulfidaeris]